MSHVAREHFCVLPSLPQPDFHEQTSAFASPCRRLGWGCWGCWGWLRAPFSGAVHLQPFSARTLTHTHLCTHVHTHMHTETCTRIYTRAHLQTCTRVHAHMDTHARAAPRHVHTHSQRHVHTHGATRAHTNTRAHLQTLKTARQGRAAPSRVPEQWERHGGRARLVAAWPESLSTVPSREPRITRNFSRGHGGTPVSVLCGQGQVP